MVDFWGALKALKKLLRVYIVIKSVAGRLVDKIGGVVRQMMGCAIGRVEIET